VIWFFTRGAGERRSCETRLSFDGPGFELIVEDNGGGHVEQFSDLGLLLARKRELYAAWRAVGWRNKTGRLPPRARPL
jgi:hypothetical protein